MLLIFEAPICEYNLSIRLRKTRLPLMVKIKKYRRERERERERRKEVQPSVENIQITMFSLQLMTKDEPRFEFGGCLLRMLLKLFLHSDHRVSTSKKEKFGQYCHCKSLQGHLQKRMQGTLFCDGCTTCKSDRDISWKDGIKRFQISN